jgi:hypothetical protein
LLTEALKDALLLPQTKEDDVLLAKVGGVLTVAVIVEREAVVPQAFVPET